MKHFEILHSSWLRPTRTAFCLPFQSIPGKSKKILPIKQGITEPCGAMRVIPVRHRDDLLDLGGVFLETRSFVALHVSQDKLFVGLCAHQFRSMGCEKARCKGPCSPLGVQQRHSACHSLSAPFCDRRYGVAVVAIFRVLAVSGGCVVFTKASCWTKFSNLQLRSRLPNLHNGISNSCRTSRTSRAKRVPKSQDRPRSGRPRSCPGAALHELPTGGCDRLALRRFKVFGHRLPPMGCVCPGCQVVTMTDDSCEAHPGLVG